MDLIRFIFRDFWTWLGTLFLILALASPFTAAATAYGREKTLESKSCVPSPCPDPAKGTGDQLNKSKVLL